MSFDLRPLSLGELLDRSFSLYRRHFWLFVGLMAAPSVFTLAIGISSELFKRISGIAEGGEPDPATLAVTVLVAIAAFLIMIVGYWIAYMVTLGATTVAVSELYVGRPATIASAYSRMKGMVGRLLLLALLIGLRLFALAFGLIVVLFAVTMVFVILVGLTGAAPAIGAFIGVLGVFGAMIATMIFALRYSVAVPALVLENTSASESIRRSVELTRGSRWRAGVLVVFAIVITYAAMALFQGPFLVGAVQAGPESTTAFWLQLVGAVTGTIGGAITGPLMIIALALFYYDIRIRKEGFDVQLMLASLDSEPAGAQA